MLLLMLILVQFLAKPLACKKGDIQIIQHKEQNSPSRANVYLLYMQVHFSLQTLQERTYVNTLPISNTYTANLKCLWSSLEVMADNFCRGATTWTFTQATVRAEYMCRQSVSCAANNKSSAFLNPFTKSSLIMDQCSEQ